MRSLSKGSHSIDSVFAEGKQLLDDLGCVRAEGIVEHRVGDEMLVILDCGGCLHGEVVMHIHVVDVCCRVHRDLVSCELLYIIKRWPVFGLSDNFGHFL